MKNKEQNINNNPIELRNEEINAILGRTPSSLVRNGIMVIFCSVLIIFTGTLFFPYPEVINCRAVVTSSNPPVHLMSQTSGHIRQLSVTDKQQVSAGQLLAVLDNPASTKDILSLMSIIDSLKNSNDIQIFKNIQFLTFMKLGDITPYFLEFQKSIAEYSSFEELRYYPQKIRAIREQIELSITYRERLKEQLQLMEQDLSIEQRNYNRDTAMFRIKVITPLEMDQSTSKLIHKNNLLISAKINLESVEMQLNQLQITNLDLQTEYHKSNRQLTENISHNLEALYNQLDYWKKNYTFYSPNEGIVSFSTVWALNQFVRAGELVMSILPLSEEKIIGKMEIPVSGSGKIKLGQEVIIKLDNYPYMEFGIVKGILTSISLVPINDFYIAEIEFPVGLISNYGISIPFNQEMGGMGEIIIEDLSLFQRFLQPIRAAIKRK